MKSRLRITQYTRHKGELEVYQQPDMFDYYYVNGRAVLHEDWYGYKNEYITYASTRVPTEEWERFIEKLKTKYESLKLHDTRQAFILKNEADEAAFILESSDWIDT